MSFPHWAEEMIRVYQGGAVNTFILHGNIHDVAPVDEKGTARFVGLKEFLIRTMFPRREMVFTYDLAQGIRVPEKAAAEGSKESTMQQVFEGFLKSRDDYNRAVTGKATGTDLLSLPREPARALPLMERFLRTRLIDRPNYRAAILIDYSHFVAPASLGYNFSQDEAACLITLHRWSSDPQFTKADITIVLLAENLADLHPLLVRSPFTAKIHIPLPDQQERREYLDYLDANGGVTQYSALTHDEIAVHTAGLSRVNLEHLVAKARYIAQQSAPAGGFPTRKLDLAALFNEKKALIEKECFGLLEFFKPARGLEAVSGHEAAKRWLTEDAKLLKDGKLDALPMGYLICGPVGTGKTYMMTCYAATLGIPCVKLMNFRSQWQGVTEGNWEKIINTLRATGPVAVIIDEADAAIGDRDSSGDSGTSQRIFAMLAQQMADTTYRGKILWFLLTARPDLLPIDMKRQGRAEVHIPLFYPDSEDEKRTYFTILAKKNGSTLAPEEVPAAALKLRLSGADIEGLVVRAKRRALLSGSDVIRAQDLQQELESFVPPSKTEEVELQILAAVIECTHQDFLPEDLKKLDRAEVAKRLALLKEMFR